MSWAELGWPDLSPEYPEPRPTEAPQRPPAPEDIGERVAAAERRRARAVKRCTLAGACLAGAGLWAEVAALRALGVALMAAGLLVAFALAAYFAWAFGPTWEQRQQHWAVLRWERELRMWRDWERERYLASLTPQQRGRFLRAVDAGKESRSEQH
jgi:hypothetical protein